jgi:hypothetical protein
MVDTLSNWVQGAGMMVEQEVWAAAGFKDTELGV